MKRKQVNTVDGEEFVTRFHDGGFLDRMREGLINLLDVALCDRHEFKAEVSITRTPEGYDYDINYGNARLSFLEIAKLQELAKNAADNYAKSISDSKGAKVKFTYYNRIFDPFGLRIRLWRSLTQ